MDMDFLQFVWQMQYFNTKELCTSSGESLEILFPGRPNEHPMLNFTHASIRINNVLWAGDIIMHLYTSNWYCKEGNDSNSIILHVVWKNDITISNNKSKSVAVLVLQERIPSFMLKKYKSWMQQSHGIIVCNADLTFIPFLIWQNWKERLVIERMQQKMNYIGQLLIQTGNNWEAVLQRLCCQISVQFIRPEQKAHFLFEVLKDVLSVKTAHNLLFLHLGVDKKMADIILIEIIVPMLFAYGKQYGECKYYDKALQWLEMMEAENHAIIQFFLIRVPIQSAFDAQAVLHLKTQYCNTKQCLRCAVGNTILKHAFHQKIH